MSLHKIYLILLAAMASSSIVFANDAKLVVAGKIKPSACAVSFPGGAVVDYGDIDPAILPASGSVALKFQTIDYSISCNIKTALKIRFVDNRATSVATIRNHFYGLGTSNGKKIGNHTLNFTPKDLKVDSLRSAKYIYSDDGITWKKISSTAQRHRVLVNRSYSFASGKYVTPVAFNNASGKIGIVPYIFVKNINRQYEVVLDGLVTIFLEYI